MVATLIFERDCFDAEDVVESLIVDPGHFAGLGIESEVNRRHTEEDDASAGIDEAANRRCCLR
jgi:hypothetical protein